MRHGPCLKSLTRLHFCVLNRSLARLAWKQDQFICWTVHHLYDWVTRSETFVNLLWPLPEMEGRSNTNALKRCNDDIRLTFVTVSKILLHRLEPKASLRYGLIAKKRHIPYFNFWTPFKVLNHKDFFWGNPVLRRITGNSSAKLEAYPTLPYRISHKNISDNDLNDFWRIVCLYLKLVITEIRIFME